MKKTLTLLVLCCGMGAVDSAVWAENKEFAPEVTFGVFHENNVQVLGTGSSTSSDQVARLGVSLPWTLNWRTGSFQLSYGARYRKYQDFESLDNLSHDFSFRLETRKSRKSTWDVTGGYSRTQDQGLSTGVVGEDVFLAPRTNRDQFQMDTVVHRTLSEGVDIDASIGVAGYRTDPIDNFTPPSGTLSLEDRDEVRSGLGLVFSRSRQTTLGVRLEHRLTDLDSSGEETVYTLAMTGSRTVGKAGSFTWEAGLFDRRSNEILNVNGDDQGFSVGLGVQRGFRRAALSVALSHVPSSGGMLGGTSTNSTAFISLRSLQARMWDWQISGGYGRRESVEGEVPNLDTISGTFSLDRWFGRSALALRLSVGAVDQSGSSDDRLNGSFVNGGVNLVWHPKGRQRGSGR